MLADQGRVVSLMAAAERISPRDRAAHADMLTEPANPPSLSAIMPNPTHELEFEGWKMFVEAQSLAEALLAEFEAIADGADIPDAHELTPTETHAPVQHVEPCERCAVDEDISAFLKSRAECDARSRFAWNPPSLSPARILRSPPRFATSTKEKFPGGEFEVNTISGHHESVLVRSPHLRDEKSRLNQFPSPGRILPSKAAGNPTLITDRTKRNASTLREHDPGELLQFIRSVVVDTERLCWDHTPEVRTCAISDEMILCDHKLFFCNRMLTNSRFDLVVFRVGS
jgi:hypothetical protein